MRRLFLLILLLVLPGAPAQAAGGVVGEAGSCMMEIGIYTAHFSIYQPEDHGEDLFCEDLPTAGLTLFVLDYLHGSLSEVPVDFRIIRDLDGLGIFARWEHVAAMDDIDERTVFYQSPRVKADQQLQVEHRFLQAGDYIGIVTAPHPSKDIVYRSVFPFKVAAWNSWWLLLIPTVIYLVWQLRRKKSD